MRNHLSRNLRLFFIGSWFSFRALFFWMTPSAYISTKLVLPLFLMLMFVFIARFVGLGNELYIVVGNALLLTTRNGVFGVMVTVSGERYFRTLPYLLGSPAPRIPLLLGRTLFHTLDGLATTTLGLIIAVLLFGLDLSQTNPVLFGGCLLLLSLTSTGFGLILGGVGLVSRQVWVYANFVYQSLFFLCGVNFPVAALPPWLQIVSYSLPMTRGIAAAREVIAGAAWAIVSPLIFGEILTGLAYATIGYFFFRYIEKRSFIDGQFEAI